MSDYRGLVRCSYSCCGLRVLMQMLALVLIVGREGGRKSVLTVTCVLVQMLTGTDCREGGKGEICPDSDMPNGTDAY